MSAYVVDGRGITLQKFPTANLFAIVSVFICVCLLKWKLKTKVSLDFAIKSEVDYARCLHSRLSSKYGIYVNYTCHYCPNKATDVNRFDGWTWMSKEEGEFRRPDFLLRHTDLTFFCKQWRIFLELQSWSVQIGKYYLQNGFISLRILREQ